MIRVIELFSGIGSQKEAIELFEDAQKYGIFVGKEKSGFLKSFLI